MEEDIFEFEYPIPIKAGQKVQYLKDKDDGNFGIPEKLRNLQNGKVTKTLSSRGRRILEIDFGNCTLNVPTDWVKPVC